MPYTCECCELVAAKISPWKKDECPKMCTSIISKEYQDNNEIKMGGVND